MTVHNATVQDVTFWPVRHVAVSCFNIELLRTVQEGVGQACIDRKLDLASQRVVASNTSSSTPRTNMFSTRQDTMLERNKIDVLRNFFEDKTKPYRSLDPQTFCGHPIGAAHLA